MDTNSQFVDPHKHLRIGRPFGSTNYGGGISFIAQQFKRQGIDWRCEIVATYKSYKAQYDAWIADPARPQPMPQLLDFWTYMMPYITLTVAEKDAYKRERKIRKVRKYTVTNSALEKLAEAEGRPQ